jgi:hypothetical protein
MNKRNVFKGIVAVFVIILLLAGIRIFITDIAGYRVKVGIGYLYEISKDLNNYHKMHADYPDSYTISKSLMKKKCLKSFYYEKKRMSNYEIKATVNNLIKKDVSLRASPDGVFIENRTRDGWQKCFDSIKE